ncbi:vacuolar er assembly vma12 [Fusarium albosuccineum]|uniref:Vacuolar er assembly vma12 n=1 Tax=Fusarium albosuccineum TaxID=1237068 RepID=A0A8H4P8W3_9HYPO|nr:vacuolar er assembly vma12 [Fusarium albosuccineum]
MYVLQVPKIHDFTYLTPARTQGPAPSRPRPRAKPLRTYGKRNARDDSPREPSPKKRRIETEQLSLKQRDSKSDDVESPSLPKIASEGSKDTSKPATTTGKSVASVAKKGSILSFFKPISSSSSTIVSSPKSDEPQPESTPPSSPPQPPRIEPRKKPRLLRFRGTSMPVLDSEDTETDAQGEEQTEEDADKEPTREPLRERQGSLANQEPTATGAKLKKQKAKSSTVQTTLNLSSQAAFSECKVCNTVWNPLYPDDVKFHTKQHAAVLRARKKSQEDEL